MDWGNTAITEGFHHARDQFVIAINLLKLEEYKKNYAKTIIILRIKKMRMTV